MKGFVTKTGGKKQVAVPVMPPRPRKQSDEICGRPGCGHVWYYHLFGGKVCGYSETKCQCAGFVPTGTYWDFSKGAERTKEPPHITDTTEQEKPSAEQLRTLVAGVPLFHTRRGACTFVGMDEADPSGLTVWVSFEGEECMVSSGFLKWAPKPSHKQGKHTKERKSCPECKRYISAAGTGHTKNCEGLARLRRMVKDRCRITDEDFRKAEPSDAQETEILKIMSEIGYTAGRSRDRQNEWWPPETTVPKSTALCGCGAEFEDTETVGAVEQLARHAAEAH